MTFIVYFQVTGYVACYEATGNVTCKAAVINFIDILLANHTWSTGGSNSDEHWGQPLQMGHFLLDVRSHLRTLSREVLSFEVFQGCSGKGMHNLSKNIYMYPERFAS